MPTQLLKITTCPFCGGENVKVWSNNTGFWVKCLACDALGPFVKDGSPARAVKAWNERHEEIEIPEVTDDAVWEEE